MIFKAVNVASSLAKCPILISPTINLAYAYAKLTVGFQR